MQGRKGHHEPELTGVVGGERGDATVPRGDAGQTATDVERAYASEEEAEIRRRPEDLGYI
jgi:hypothetical protein